MSPVLFRPTRPASVWVLAVLAWLTGGLFDVMADPRGHATTFQSSVFTWTAFTSGVIVVGVILFIAGQGWSRALLAVLYVLAAAWPVIGYLQDRQYYRSVGSSMPPSVSWWMGVPGFALGVVVIVAMCAMPSVRAWLRDLGEWRRQAYLPVADAAP